MSKILKDMQKAGVKVHNKLEAIIRVNANDPDQACRLATEKICNDIDKHVFDELCQERIRFYVDHMMEEDLWPTEGKVFMNYLDDLSKARNIDWRINLKEMELDRYDPR